LRGWRCGRRQEERERERIVASGVRGGGQFFSEPVARRQAAAESGEGDGGGGRAQKARSSASPSLPHTRPALSPRGARPHSLWRAVGRRRRLPTKHIPKRKSKSKKKGWRPPPRPPSGDGGGGVRLFFKAARRLAHRAPLSFSPLLLLLLLPAFAPRATRHPRPTRSNQPCPFSSLARARSSTWRAHAKEPPQKRAKNEQQQQRRRHVERARRRRH
jgi:hypothetical protein